MLAGQEFFLGLPDPLPSLRCHGIETSTLHRKGTSRRLWPENLYNSQRSLATFARVPWKPLMTDGEVTEVRCNWQVYLQPPSCFNKRLFGWKLSLYQVGNSSLIERFSS